MSKSLFDSRAFLASCSSLPGVYRMSGSDGKLLYIGKARDLRARLTSYFVGNITSAKTRALVSRIATIDVTVTHSEAEALLLEQSLIKQHRPPYNILLRDDKSYPYIRITTSDEWPRVAFHRGQRRSGSRYFGPYPSGASVREALALLEKVFQLRNCRDSYFRNRTRPCLQYEIRRCTAPCVGLVSEQDYARQVQMAMAFLDGKDASVTDQMTQLMEQAAEALNFEAAADIRDRLSAIRQVQQKQHVDTGSGDVDVIAVGIRHGLALIEILMIRGGRMLGHRTIKPVARGEDSEATVLSAFLPAYYLNERPDQKWPAEIIVEHELEDGVAIVEAIGQRFARKVRLAHSVRGQRAAWLNMAQQNLDQALTVQLMAAASLQQRFDALIELLALPEPIERIECFDISHTQGEKAVASCVVFGPEGALKGDYRRFNVEPEVGGDDYAAMEEAVRRRYQRVQKEQGKLPGLLLIDGGKGQVGRACKVLVELGLDQDVPVLGIAKGPSRKAGEEVLIAGDGREWLPGPDHVGLHLLQQVRDEAHRFAITGHRQRRGKARNQSALEEVPGVGAVRRKALLSYFGGLDQLRNASAEQISRVNGISKALASHIYAWLHET
ncbi:MAG: excinuclease ABC subunit UvrC [Gammaproteobacteria bacterium]|nr:excinuclease ABC subunit UvrC [Gammaproteobacteria bacterium]MBQ0775776.1 excinuclease ABC subunit UvrC [Gammaproteobacteria bacterium]